MPMCYASMTNVYVYERRDFHIGTDSPTTGALLSRHILHYPEMSNRQLILRCNWCPTVATSTQSLMSRHIPQKLLFMKSLTVTLWIKPTDTLKSSFIGITTLHVMGSLSVHHQEFLAMYRLWYILCSSDDRMLPGVRWNSW